MSYIIAGIDPGVQNLGISLLDTSNMSVIEVLKYTWEDSYFLLEEFLLDFLDDRADDISLEKPFFTPLTLAKNIRTLEVIGIIKLAAQKLGLSVYEYSPTTIKKTITGNGRADKKEIIQSVSDRFQINTKVTHEADAIAIAYTHYITTCPPKTI
jgi:crossover junction endodeoxyribonuclease RuvC